MSSYNILFGANAQLPDATKSKQISIGTSAETVYFASSTGAGGVRAGAAGFAVAGAAAITASGEAGSAGAPLMSGGGAAPYWGSITQLTSAATMTLPPRLTKSYTVTGSTPWALTLPAPAGASLWLKNESSATGTVSAPGGVVSWGSTAIGAGTSVTLPPGASSQFASDQSRWYALGPEPPPIAVAAASPNTGDIDGTTIVTITGTGFASGATVTIGGTTAAAVTYVNSNTLLVVTGAAASAGTYSITVTNPGGATATGGSYTYAASAPPTVLAISPNTGELASSPPVTITGSCFKSGAIQSVTIGGVLVQNVVCANDSTITGRAGVAPAPNPTASVVVTTTNGSNAANTLFSYTELAPVITSISPAVGNPAGGTTVTLTGRNFLDTTAVSFGSAAVTFTVLSDTQISAVTAPNVSSSPNVFPQVTATGTSTNTTVVYTYTSEVIPTVLQALAPIVAIGDQITLVGANFTGATGVRIEESSLLGYAVVDDSHITLTAPSNTAGNVVNIFVTNVYGDSTTHASVTYQTGSQTFSATGVNQSFQVPVGATNAVAIVSGSPGAVVGGTGASITGAFLVNAGETYTIVCGGVSTYAGGSATVYDNAGRPLGGGGGYSGIFRASANVNANGAPTQNFIGGSVIVAAGGGGGFSLSFPPAATGLYPGGAAGLWSGAYFNSSVGAGGTGGVANSNGTGSPGSGASQFQGVSATYIVTPQTYFRTGGGSGFYGGGATYNGDIGVNIGSGGASYVNPAVNFISSAANSGIGGVTIKYA